MARRGRKRRATRRQPNGQPYRPPEVNPLELAKAWPHRRANADQISDHRGECELGRLSLDGVISQEHYAAGVRFREITGRMRRAIAAPNPNAKSLTLVASDGRRIDDLDFLDPEAAKEIADKARREYADAVRALSEAGRDAELAVKHIVIDDHDRFRAGVFDLRAGLNFLARHFGMLGRARA